MQRISQRSLVFSQHEGAAVFLPIGAAFLTLMTVAIVDDIGIYALFYAANINLVVLALAGVLLATLPIVKRSRLLHSAPYVLLGIFLWVFVLQSGGHSALSVLGFASAGQMAAIKLGIFCGALCSALLGYAILRQSSKSELN